MDTIADTSLPLIIRENNLSGLKDMVIALLSSIRAGALPLTISLIGLIILESD